MYTVAESLEAILFQEPYVLPVTTPPAAVDPILLESYAGSYQLQEGPVFHVKYEEGVLRIFIGSKLINGAKMG